MFYNSFRRLILLAMAAVLSFLVLRNLPGPSDLSRLQRNQNILLHNGHVEISTTPSGHSMATVPALSLKKSELGNARVPPIRVAKQLGVRPSRLKAAATVSTQSSLQISTPSIPDTISKDTLSPVTYSFSYADPYIVLNGHVRADSTVVDFLSRDTLDIVVHRIPKRFLFFRFGCREVRMDILSRNPHTRLTYARYYRLVK